MYSSVIFGKYVFLTYSKLWDSAIPAEYSAELICRSLDHSQLQAPTKLLPVSISLLFSEHLIKMELYTMCNFC